VKLQDSVDESESVDIHFVLNIFALNLLNELDRRILFVLVERDGMKYECVMFNGKISKGLWSEYVAIIRNRCNAITQDVRLRMKQECGSIIWKKIVMTEEDDKRSRKL
jgi:hypothetical protein